MITLNISSDATFEELASLSLSDLYMLPTLHQGQYDNLKFESSLFRVWYSRMRLEDYNGDHEAYNKNRIVIEKLINGRWTVLDKYGRVQE